MRSIRSSINKAEHYWYFSGTFLGFCICRLSVNLASILLVLSRNLDLGDSDIDCKFDESDRENAHFRTRILRPYLIVSWYLFGRIFTIFVRQKVYSMQKRKLGRGSWYVAGSQRKLSDLWKHFFYSSTKRNLEQDSLVPCIEKLPDALLQYNFVSPYIWIN